MKWTIGLVLVTLLMLGCAQKQSSETVETERWWTEEDRTLILSELNRATEWVRREIESLSPEQWNFKEDPSRWSIGEIVEHLEMQNQLHFREISVTSRAPEQTQYRPITKGKDSLFTNYATDVTPGKAQWFLEPKGKFCSKEECETAFYKAREELSRFVIETNADLRKHVTYRNSVNGKEIEDLSIGDVRDLHQLLLIGIAHTYRHITQIRNIKQHPDYPKEK